MKCILLLSFFRHCFLFLVRKKITKFNTYYIWESCIPERFRVPACMRGSDTEKGIELYKTF